ncbi:hypothetical protein C8J56DRAFT_501177 [Mycena floridula]|nr:hypothetical protein C8J56DRAFT_501177 [Mycena floridula]
MKLSGSIPPGPDVPHDVPPLGFVVIEGFRVVGDLWLGMSPVIAVGLIQYGLPNMNITTNCLATLGLTIIQLGLVLWSIRRDSVLSNQVMHSYLFTIIWAILVCQCLSSSIFVRNLNPCFSQYPAYSAPASRD